MIKALSIIFLFSCISGFSQNSMSDVVKLVDGNVIKGTIKEQVPGQFIKICTKDSSVFVINFEKIASISKEERKSGHLFNYASGTTIETITTDMKGNKTSSMLKIIGVTGDELLYETVNSISKNQFQKDNGTLKIQNETMMYQIPEGEGMKLSENSAKYFDYPLSPKLGQKLSDILVSGTASFEGLKSKIEMKYSNREIIGIEDISTAAGIFNCYILSFQLSNKIMGIPINIQTKQWISDRIGIVKTESYRKNKLISTSIITSIK